MVTTKEKEVIEIKNRAKLVKSYYEFMNVYNPLVEKIKEANGIKFYIPTYFRFCFMCL